MVAHNPGIQSAYAVDAAETLIEFARLTLRAAGSAPGGLHAIAGELLDHLVAFCAAHRGALFLPTLPELDADGASPTQLNIVGYRALAAYGMPTEDASTLLAAITAPDLAVYSTVGETRWMRCFLPLELPSSQGSSATDDGDAQARTLRALLLIGWAADTGAAEVMEQGSAGLTLIADAAGAVLTSALLAARARAREDAAAHSEALLREERQVRSEWEQTVDAVSDPICLLTPDFRIVRANQAYIDMFGLDHEQCVGHACFVEVAGRESPCQGCPLPHTAATSRPAFLRQERMLPTGPNRALERRVFQSWTYPVRDQNGGVEGVVEIIKDVTEQERLREAMSQAEALREADRLKSELLGTVSHELRSPLAAIKGYAATLLRHERRLAREERRDFLVAIDEASARLAIIIDRLLEMSQLGTGSVQLHRVPVDVVHVAREAITAAERAATRRSTPYHEFTLRVVNAEGRPTHAVPPLSADARRLREVLDNLLENAVKYSPDGGEVEVLLRSVPAGHTRAARHTAPSAATPEGEPDAEAAPGRPALEICVRDTGVGIPDEHLGRIFERFHRVDMRLTREVDGLGLGLAICKRIVELHGGTIWAESRPGKGSTFHVLLPLEI